MKHPTATKIFVENLSLDAQIGIYPHEYGRSQCITLEVELDATDVSQAAASEELNDTLNYEIIAETAQNVVAQRHFPLVETLVTEIADALLALPQARSARVRLAKQGCLEDAEAAAELTTSPIPWWRSTATTSRNAKRSLLSAVALQE